MDNRQLFARRGRSRQHLAMYTILQSPHCSPHTLGRHSAYPHATPFTNDFSHPSLRYRGKPSRGIPITCHEVSRLPLGRLRVYLSSGSKNVLSRRPKHLNLPIKERRKERSEILYSTFALFPSVLIFKAKLNLLLLTTSTLP